MQSVLRRLRGSSAVLSGFALLLAITLSGSFNCQGQTLQAPNSIGDEAALPAVAAHAPPEFRLERLPVADGAELITIFGKLSASTRDGNTSASQEVPIISLLRDTLKDTDPENDRLRYVWMLTYTNPSAKQKIAAAVPFLYAHVEDKKRASQSAPPPLIDLAATGQRVWGHFFWTALQTALIDPVSLSVKASTRTYRRNAVDYREAHIARALSVLSLYETTNGASHALPTQELHEIQSRLLLSEKLLGGIVDDVQLPRVYGKHVADTNDVRGHNWELLRQRAEAEALLFEPLELPDGSATHALLYVSRADLERKADRSFDKRFLNIASPWRDQKLLSWKGYTQTVYLDADNNRVAKDTPGARKDELIPLALYGLDHPKIPILLVDFRNQLNPKKREVSRRALEDVTRNILSLSRFGDVPYFFGRTLYNFVTNRRGMDVNQPSRLRAVSQLKLLLALNETLDPQLRDNIDRRLNAVSSNPLDNDYEAESQLARRQYAALLDYARRPEGLPARLELDRRAEAMPLVHGRAERTLFRAANILSFNLYTHREKSSATLDAKLDIQRRLAFHERFLREASRSSPQIEVVQNIEDVKRSLRFVAEHGAAADKKTALATARIFAYTQDDETRRLCINGLYRINNETAKKELLHLYQNGQLEAVWRTLSAEYLRMAVREEQRIAPADAKIISAVVGQ
ncbi:MAG: hypothetical protein ACR2LC_14455 [Pyrinomonadaceae bacterium]